MIRRSVALVGLVAALALSGCASDDWEGRYNELHGEMLDVVAQRDDARDQAADAFAGQEALAAQAAQRDRQIEDLRRAANENADLASQYADALKAELDKPKTTAAAVPKFDAQAIAAELGQRHNIDTVVTDDGNIEMRIPADVTFASGEATLTKSGRQALRGIAPDLSGRFASYQIRVEGHTDNEPLKRTLPKWGSNRGLGSARANAVTQFLESEFAIAPERIVSLSKGENEPLVPNTSKANKAKNRRVAIVVVIPNDTVETMAK